MIYLAAFFDGLMALVLVVIYFRVRMNVAREKNKGVLKEEVSMDPPEEQA